MSLARALVLLGLGLIFVGILTQGRKPAAGAADPVVITADYGENTEEIATQRWATGQPRHWRQVVTHR